MQSIAVFCGSSSGTLPIYTEMASATGKLLAQSGITLVYGGGRVGLMGAVADAALAAGGRVVGVMPRLLVEREIAHQDLSELHVVDSMHERKALMTEMSAGFIAMPGGAGTFEELFEQWTWAQLGIHDKPCGILNVANYFDPLLNMLDRMITAGFMRQTYRDMLVIDTEPEGILRQFSAYQAPQKKWQATPKNQGDACKIR